jgi:enamine deaminase RidA (YjgF/YER057c/UK114 family)
MKEDRRFKKTSSNGSKFKSSKSDGGREFQIVKPSHIGFRKVKFMDIQRINPREWNCSAAVFGDLVFLSGTVADDKSLDMKGQTAQVLQKIDAVLAKAGSHKSRILSATVYMADASLKDEMNEAWMAWVDRSNLPTRTAVGAVLTPGTMVEITICAAK